MANIKKFVRPDGTVDERDVITAYKVASGLEYFVVDTTRKDEVGNTIVGVSYKPVNEERFQKIVDMEEWKKAKGLLVKDLHNEKDGFEHMEAQEENLVTEDYVHDLALRAENLANLTASYEEFLKKKQEKEQENTVGAPEINPFATPEVAEVKPEIAEAPVTNTIVEDIPSIVPTPEVAQAPVMDTQIVDFPGVQNNIIEEQPQASIPSIAPVEEVITSAPSTDNVISEAPAVEPVIQESPVTMQGMDIPIAEERKEVGQNDTVKTELTDSAVANSYIESINKEIENIKKSTESYIKVLENSKVVFIENFKQIQDLRQLAETTVRNAEAVMANANNNHVVPNNMVGFPGIQSNEEEQVLRKSA